MISVVGADISLNHAAYVALDEDGQVSSVGYTTNTKKGAKAHKGGLCIPKREKGEDHPEYALRRLMWLADVFTEWAKSWMPDPAPPERDRGRAYGFPFVSLEGYAYKAMGKSYHLGEVGGLFKMVMARRGMGIRIHDPATVKIFATGRGNAPKPDVDASACHIAANKGLDLGEFPERVSASIREDVGDAMILADMAWMEKLVRAGVLSLDELTEQRRRVFLRVTKYYSTNLLDRRLA